MENDHIPTILEYLPIRFEDLSEDISLLNQDKETTEKLWRDLLSINQRASHSNDTLFSPQGEPDNAELRLGYEVGSMLELVMSGFASKQDRTDVARGFVLAFTGEAREGIDEDRITALEFAHLLAEKHPPTVRSNINEANRMLKASGIDEQTENAIQNVLEQRGLRPSFYLVNLIRESAELTTKEYSSTNPEGNVSFTHYETSVSTSEAESVVDAFLQTHPEIEVFDNLCSLLVEDAPLVYRKKNRGTPIKSIVKHLWQTERGSTASSIDHKITTNTHLPHTTHALYSLSGEYDSKLWTNRPVAVELSDGWRLTSYGDIIAYLLFEVGMDRVGEELRNRVEDSDPSSKFIKSLVFNTKLLDLLYKTSINPADIDPEFVRLVEEMYKNDDSCKDWRKRVSKIVEKAS